MKISDLPEYPMLAALATLGGLALIGLIIGLVLGAGEAEKRESRIDFIVPPLVGALMGAFVGCMVMLFPLDTVAQKNEKNAIADYYGVNTTSQPDKFSVVNGLKYYDLTRRDVDGYIFLVDQDNNIWRATERAPKAAS